MPKGIPDPDRANRIAVAALRVVQQGGVEALTHRAVAAAAEVPFSSTTYYFKTVDGLLAAALGVAKETTDVELERLSDELAGGADLVTTLAAYLNRIAETELPRSKVEYELWLSALRREELRPVSVAWGNALPDMLSRHTDVVTAQALTFAFDGLLLHAILQGAGRPKDEVEMYLRRALGSAG